MSTVQRVLGGGGFEFVDRSTAETVRPVHAVYFCDDFLGQAIDATNDWTLLDTGAATETLKADAPNGVLELALTNANEAQLAGVDSGDQRTLALDHRLQVEFRARFTTLPTGAVVAVLGVCGDHNAAVDSVAESVWFRFDGSGACTVETDDGTHETSRVATGVTLMADAWHVFRIDLGDPARVQFWIDGRLVALGTTFDVSAAPTLALQPVARIGKEGAATSVGTMEIDYVRAWQDR